MQYRDILNDNVYFFHRSYLLNVSANPKVILFAVLGSFFIVLAHLNALLQFGLKDQKPIPWRGRKTQA